MVAIVTASILPSYTIPHNSPSSSLSLPPVGAIPSPSYPPSPSSPFLTLLPSNPAPLSATDIPLYPSSALVVFSLLTLCSSYSIPSPLLSFADTTSADIKLRYQLPRRQTTARSPAMNLRVGARVLQFVGRRSEYWDAARARWVNARVHARPRRLTRDNRRVVISHAIREKPVAPNIPPIFISR